MHRLSREIYFFKSTFVVIYLANICAVPCAILTCYLFTFLLCCDNAQRGVESALGSISICTIVPVIFSLQPFVCSRFSLSSSSDQAYGLMRCQRNCRIGFDQSNASISTTKSSPKNFVWVGDNIPGRLNPGPIHGEGGAKDAQTYLSPAHIFIQYDMYPHPSHLLLPMLLHSFYTYNSSP